MPIVQTWIKDDDYSKYLVVRSSGKHAWGEFIHNALNGVTVVGAAEFSAQREQGGVLIKPTKLKPIKTPKEEDDAIVGMYMGKPPIIKTPKDAEKATQARFDEKLDKLVDVGRKQLAKLCKIHGTPLDNRGKCLQKGCKYA